jgi:hypothetical protein
MNTALPKYLHQHVRAAVENLGAIFKFRNRVQKSLHLYNARHLVQGTKFGAHYRDEFQSGRTRKSIAVRFRKFPTEPAPGQFPIFRQRGVCLR